MFVRIVTKWFEEILPSLKILPDRFVERYTRVLETPLTLAGRRKIVSALTILFIEIENLVKAEMARMIDGGSARHG